MRIVCIVATAIALVAAPAFAQSARKAKAQRPPPGTSYEVYSGDRRIGTDPDPNIRFELLREQNWRKGG